MLTVYDVFKYSVNDSNELKLYIGRMRIWTAERRGKNS